MTAVKSRCSFRELAKLVGNTPLLALELLFRGQRRRLFAKAENFNFTGSIKDRMALHIMRKAHETGVLKPGAPIAEATSGNTGISFAALGCAMGHPVTIFMPDWMSQERKDLIRCFGAEVRFVSVQEGGFLGSIRLSEEWAARTLGAFLPCQFSNEANAEAHFTTTGPEIWAPRPSTGCLRGRRGHRWNRDGRRAIPQATQSGCKDPPGGTG
jgi:cysteine synthase A